MDQPSSFPRTSRRVLVPQSDEDDDIYDRRRNARSDSILQKSGTLPSRSTMRAASTGHAPWMNAGNRMELLSASIRGRVLVSPWRPRQQQQQEKQRRQEPRQRHQSQEQPQHRSSPRVTPSLSQQQEQHQEQLHRSRLRHHPHQRPQEPQPEQQLSQPQQHLSLPQISRRSQRPQRSQLRQPSIPAQVEAILARVKIDHSQVPLAPAIQMSNSPSVQEPQESQQPQHHILFPPPYPLTETKVKQENIAEQRQVLLRDRQSERSGGSQGHVAEQVESLIPVSPIVANHVSPTSWQHEPSMEFVNSTPVQEAPMYTQSLLVAASTTPSSNNASESSTPAAAEAEADEAVEHVSQSVVAPQRELSSTKEHSFQRSLSTPNLPSSSPQAAETFSKKKKRKRQSQSTTSSPPISSSMMFAADLSDITSYLEKDLSGFETRPSF